MNKFAVTLLALAAFSTASFAGSPGDQNGAERDTPALFNDNMPSAKPSVEKSYIGENALSTGQKFRTQIRENYINASQLR